MEYETARPIKYKDGFKNKVLCEPVEPILIRNRMFLWWTTK